MLKAENRRGNSEIFKHSWNKGDVTVTGEDVSGMGCVFEEKAGT